MNTPDSIPLEDEFSFKGPDADGGCRASFYAFNTIVTLQAFAGAAACREAFAAARDACRRYERLFSRTLPRSDISRLNAAGGAWRPIAAETFDLLQASLRFCAASEGVFDVTIGPVVRLWDFNAGIIPAAGALDAALSHVDWHAVQLEAAGGRHRARLADPQASVDVGGTAKGWIADRLGVLLAGHGLTGFLVDLGGNTLAHGTKPDGSPWRIGVQDPRRSRSEEGAVLAVASLKDASAVTSGVYERGFVCDGVLYHHILDPKTGRPAKTDLAGATVIAKRSLDAEGFSTTLLALGSERAASFAQERPEILAAFLVFPDGDMRVVG